ncbi:MAG: efflux RND transporter periplasmic adaptor subunit [Vicinamibacterales bacterium]
MIARFGVFGIRQFLALLLSAGIMSACGSPEATVDATAPGTVEAAPAPVAVAVQPAVERALPQVVRATGTFVADEISEVTPQVSGQVIETPVDVGDVVKAGQLLVRLDDRDARLRLMQAEAALQQAQAQAARAQAEAKRNADLVQSGDISRSAYEQLTTQVAVAEAAVAQADAQVAGARKALQDTQILAPFSGHVSARDVAIGEYVSTSANVATIVRITPIKLDLRVPESNAANVQRGMTVTAMVPAHPETTFTGEISALNVAIDPASRSMTIAARFPNNDGRLMPGMFGTADVQLPASEAAVLVPPSAIVSIANGEATGVFVVEGDTARMRVVQTGGQHDGLVRILAGLEAGTPVVVSNVAQLIDGSLIRVESGSIASATADPGVTPAPSGAGAQ